jgi:FtsP/CotA-like multicopper oxidase with cupredoxin domain
MLGLPGWLTRRQILARAGICAAALALPRLAGSQTASEDGFITIRARQGTAALRGPTGGAPTPIWGFDGTTPGPLLRVRRGQELKVRVTNDLPEPTVVHWHGVRLPNAMDGVPHLTQAPIAPGASFEYRFAPPDAGTFWYHSHQFSSEQLARGLCGALIVDENEPVDVDRDVALVISDWRLKTDGTIDEASFRSMHDAAMAGRTGNHVTANGMPVADVPVKTNERLRLRFINAANARIMILRLDRHRPFVAAIDGQPSEVFAARDGRILLGPGNRIDLIVNATLEPGAVAPILLEADDQSVAVARLVYDTLSGARTAPRPDPKPLPANPLPARMDFSGALRVDVPIEGGMMGGGGRAPQRDGFAGAPIWSLAGRASDGHSGAPLFSVKRGRTVMLAFNNRTAFPHAMHLHGHHCRLLDRLDDGWKPFWLDTVLVPPQQTWRIAFVADNPGKWMLHCHMLEHQETGMAAWFEVT